MKFLILIILGAVVSMVITVRIATWREAADAASKANEANSVPALRAEVARLAELVESLLEIKEQP
jgi:uncharacterized protein YpmS